MSSICSINRRQFGRTENIKNSLDPSFARLFELDYFFEMVQKIRVMVYDIDNQTPKLSDDDFLGSIECTLGEVSMALQAWEGLRRIV